MTHTLLISIFCPDKTGLISSITNTLFDLGVNFGDTNFAVLGAGAEFTAVCESPVGSEEVEKCLRFLPGLEGADIKVSYFNLPATHGPTAEITHQITLQGQDHPGLLAQLTGVLMTFNANIVRLNAERIPGHLETQYLIHLWVYLPESRAEACLASISNTASFLQMHCHWGPV
jgi:glycine cleavage system transcriptional repressor